MIPFFLKIYILTGIRHDPKWKLWSIESRKIYSVSGIRIEEILESISDILTYKIELIGNYHPYSYVMPVKWLRSPFALNYALHKSKYQIIIF